MAKLSSEEKALLEAAKNRLAVVNAIAEKEKQIAKDYEKTGEYNSKLNTELEKQQRQLKKIDKFLNGNNQKIKDGIDLYKESASSISSMSSMMGGLKDELQKTTKFGIDFSKSIANSNGANKAAFEDSNRLLADITSLTAELAQLNKEDSVEIASKANEIDSLYSKLNGNVLELTRKGKRMNQNDQELLELLLERFNMTGNLIGQASKFANVSKDTKEIYEELGSTLNTIQKTLQKVAILLSGPKVLLAAALYYAGELFDEFVNISKEIGGSIFQMNGFKNQVFAVTKLLGDEAGQAVTNLASKLGNANLVSVGLGFNVGLMANRLGVSGEEAANLVNMFGNLSGLSSDNALNIMEATSQLAMANGIAPKAVMADIAQNTEYFAKYSKNGGENIAQAAIQARRLGVDLSTAEKVSDSLLDYQTSVASEMEASVLLGRNLNLNRARELAYMGKGAEAMQAALEAAGGINAFNKMDVFQRKAVADAIGVSASELQQMAANQERALTPAGKLEGMFNSISAYGGQLAETVGGTALKGMGGLLLAAKGFKDQIADAKEGFDFIKDIGKSAGQFFRNGSLSKALQSREEKAIKGLTGGPMVSNEPTTPSSRRGRPPKVKSFLDGVGNPGQILAAAAALVALAASVLILSYAFQNFSSVTGAGFLAGIGAMAAFVGMTYALIPALTSLSAMGPALLPAIGILLAIGGAVALIGVGVSMLSNSFKDIGIEQMAGFAIGMVAFAGSVMMLSTALSMLGNPLAVVGAATLGAVALAGGAVAGVGAFLGGGNENTSLENKIDELIQAIKDQDVVLKVDGRVIAKTVRIAGVKNSQGS